MKMYFKEMDWKMKLWRHIVLLDVYFRIDEKDLHLMCTQNRDKEEINVSKDYFILLYTG